MPKPDKNKIIPWLGVVFAGLLLGALGRHIALQQSEDIGTANLTFVIVLAGIVFMYLLFLILWDSIHQIISKKKTGNAHSDDLSEDVDDERYESEQTSNYSFAYTDIVGYGGGAIPQKTG